MKLELDNVTICAVDCLTPELAARAILKSSENISFGKRVLFTDSEIHGDFETKKIPKIKSKAAYSEFLIKHLNSFVETDFVLIVQWDGYVIYPHCWTDEFLKYDYIGAKWGWYEDGFNMGNGGFSLRSKKLLNAINDPRFIFHPEINEDELICRQNRNFLEAVKHISFAPLNIADQFSYERSPPNKFTLGYHGLFNLWRHEQDNEVIQITTQLPAQVFISREYFELMGQYFVTQKFDIFLHLFSLQTNFYSREQLIDAMKAVYKNDSLLQEILAFSYSNLTLLKSN